MQARLIHEPSPGWVAVDKHTRVLCLPLIESNGHTCFFACEGYYAAVCDPHSSAQKCFPLL
jgi:hypothetical protein